MKKIVFRALLGLLVVYLSLDTISTYINTSNTHIANNTLMIVNGQGGGTGVVLQSSPIVSSVLTNRHVCEAIRHLGHIIKDSGETFEIIDFRESKTHDLCFIRASGDMHGGVRLASRAPATYDDAIVSGHPHLMPTVILHGHFAHKVAINVGSDILPVQAQALSVLIGPGSSGSAVYNNRGELSGMVFAGMGMLGFAYIVPYEYVAYFLNQELGTIVPEVIAPTPPEPPFPGLTIGRAPTINLVTSCTK